MLSVIFMSFYSGQTKLPHMWTFVLSAIKVNLVKTYYFRYLINNANSP